MKWMGKFQAICKELETSMNRLTAILTYEPDMSDEEKLVVLSLFEVTGTSFMAFGDLAGKGNEADIDKALVELQDIQLRMSFIIDKHPLIESLTG